MSKTYKYKLEAEASLKSLFESISEDSVQFERERIIRLLKEHLGYGDAEWDSSVMAIIALIKGEQK